MTGPAPRAGCFCFANAAEAPKFAFFALKKLAADGYLC